MLLPGTKGCLFRLISPDYALRAQHRPTNPSLGLPGIGPPLGLRPAFYLPVSSLVSTGRVEHIRRPQRETQHTLIPSTLTHTRALLPHPFRTLPLLKLTAVLGSRKKRNPQVCPLLHPFPLHFCRESCQKKDE